MGEKIAMKKEDLLKNIETVKQEVEDGKITDLLIAGSNPDGNVTTKITANGAMALGLAEILKGKIKKRTAESRNQVRFSKYV